MLPTQIPVIDLFAGPGGLGEGFSCVRTPDNRPCFDVKLSVEKDPIAHRTLELRSAVRSAGGPLPEIYYEYMRGRITREVLFAHVDLKVHAERAKREAWNMTLSPENHAEVSRRVAAAVHNATFWILIGGPPCQAYSLVGRSRMRADGIKRFEKDARHFLYREYLRILRDHLPPVFIMENVKGLLSATHGKSRMFEMIVEDLSRPMPGGPRYRILPFTVQGERPAGSSRDYVVKSERFGVPQARHRVFLCGVREDVTQDPYPLEPESPPNVLDVLEGLPSIRSCLSKETDSIEKWISALTEATAAVTRLEPKHYNEIALMMDSALEKAKVLRSSGGRFVSCDDRDFINEARPSHPLREWLVDLAIKGFAGHDARSHMRTDLHRYFYAASFAQVTGRSPKLDDFPAHMAPNHANVKSRGKTTKSTPFKDRFRVQVGNRPSSTIVSHIAKDGHYFIHPDPSQCRSLTVREAARLQTFPDNYHFEGTRTQQFGQIGNAVPPYLAAKIAASIYGLALG